MGESEVCEFISLSDDVIEARKTAGKGVSVCKKVLLNCDHRKEKIIISNRKVQQKIYLFKKKTIKLIFEGT